MISLTVTMITEINRQILQISPEINERSLGGILRDSAILDFLIEELEQIEDPFEKAAIILQKIAIRHPFWQGNKRTAFVSANIILILAGYEMNIDGEILNHDIREIITEEWSVLEVKRWILRNIVKIEIDE